MERTIDINGFKYVKQGSDFQRRTDKVVHLLGTEMLEALAEAKAIIAGGAVLSIFTQQEVNDVDVYFRDIESMTKAFIKVTRYWDTVYLGHTDKSITLKDRDSDTIVQFIYFKFFSSAKAVFEAFDFTVCMAAVELQPEGQHELVMHPQFLSDVASRTLHFNNGTCFPYISLLRTRKYKERGYKIGKGNFLAIGIACAGKQINNWDEAREQLGGVYGYHIDLEVENDEPFTSQRLHDVVTSIREFDYSSNQDYEACFLLLTGKSTHKYYEEEREREKKEKELEGLEL